MQRALRMACVKRGFASKTLVGFGAAPWGDLTHSSRAVRVADTIYVSGTVSQGDTVAEQVKGCFAIIDEAIRNAGGRGLEDVVLTRMIAADVGELDELTSAHKAVFEATGNRPAQTTYGGTLVREWIKVEIEATAVVQAE
uniref:RidA family protein n=1 Tax=Noctiluca scintillans TaxID=2966 RepID=A0A7S1FGL1_NOCSC